MFCLRLARGTSKRASDHSVNPSNLSNVMIPNTHRMSPAFVTKAFQTVLTLSLTGLTALAQDTNAPGRMKPTVVTGSYIPTAETVGPAPVETISPAQIEKTGTQDLLVALKSLSASFTGGANLGPPLNNAASAPTSPPLPNPP